MNLKTFLFATLAMIGLGSSAVAQTTAPPAIAKVDLKTDAIAYDNGTTIDVNRHGHLIVKSGKWTLLFDPKTHTLTNPIRIVNERIDRFTNFQLKSWHGVGVFLIKDGKIVEWYDYTIASERA